MLIFGSSVSDWKAKAKYAVDKADNEYAKLHEVRCEGIEDVETAMAAMAAFASDSKCRQFIYHATINLNPGERLTHAQWLHAVETLERNLLLTGHYRVMFEHIKKDRQHYHIYWSRIPPEAGPAVNMGYDYIIHQKTAKRLEKEFGLKPAPRKDESKPSRKKEEMNDRNSKVRVKPDIVTAEVTGIFKTSRKTEYFLKRLNSAGYTLCRGKKGSLVLVDRQGGYHGLMRRIEGARIKDLRKKFPELEDTKLPDLKAVLNIHRPAPARHFKKAARVYFVRQSKGYRPSYSPSFKTITHKPQGINIQALIAQYRRAHPEGKTRQSYPAPVYMRKKRRKRYENELPRPDINLREIELAELLEWAWENKRLDILQDFGIRLPADYFEP